MSLKIKYQKLMEKYRQELHRIPELGFQEKKTHQYLWDILKSLDIFNLHVYAKTGIIAEYKCSDGDYIAFRSDIDGLAIAEETNLEFQSEYSGFMHACGHDLHMSILLGFANYIKDERPQNNILLIFQPAEEGQGGGKLMVEEGLFNDFHVVEIYALHNTTEFEVGCIACNEGKMFAGTIEFEINLKGKGGHAAMPHLAKDINLAGTNLVVNLNTVCNRFINPVEESVLTIGYVQGGTAANIIPENFQIKGTARAYSKSNLECIRKKILDMTKAISLMFNVEYEIKYISEYVPAINNALIAKKILDNKDNSDYKIIHCSPKMTGEDFGFMLQKVPGIICWLGAADREHSSNFGLHNSHYNPSEKCLVYGLAFYANILNNFKIK